MQKKRVYEIIMWKIFKVELFHSGKRKQPLRICHHQAIDNTELGRVMVMKTYSNENIE